MLDCSPLLIPTLCRYKHLKRCIDSLLKNRLASNTHLYIALDYPLMDCHKDGYNKILIYLNSLSGFAKVTIIKRSSNFGAVKNYQEAMKEVLSHYESVIFSEDDNEFSPNFLEFMNMGLKLFEGDKRVYAICGYNYPIDLPNNYTSNHYFWKGFSAWGYGIWKQNYFNYEFNAEEVVKYIGNYSFLRKQNKLAPVFYRTLVGSVKENSIMMDAYISMKLLIDNRFCVFPAVSKVRNWGHDGTGEHCGLIAGKNIYAMQYIDQSTSFEFNNSNIIDNISINFVLKSFFKIPFKSNIKNHLLCLLYSFKYKFFK